jgi:hypothetical protein
MRLTLSDTVDHVDLNRSFRRPSSSHEERILRRNFPPASFCENFVLAAFSTFSTESTPSRRRILVWPRCHAVTDQQDPDHPKPIFVDLDQQVSATYGTSYSLRARHCPRRDRRQCSKDAVYPVAFVDAEG